MRWPWVSRSHHEDVIALYECRIEEMAASRNRAQAQEWSILGKYTELANPPALVPTPAQQAPHQEPSFVATIIRDQSKHDPRLAAYLKSYATQLKADGMSEDEIGMALTQWTTTESLDS